MRLIVRILVYGVALKIFDRFLSMIDSHLFFIIAILQKLRLKNLDFFFRGQLKHTQLGLFLHYLCLYSKKIDHREVLYIDFSIASLINIELVKVMN